MSNVVRTVSISHEAALRTVSTGIEIGARHGIAACITVVDPALGMVAMGRADGTTPHSVETSRRKATTAASTRRATGWMQGDFAIALPLGTGNSLTNIKGGVPIIFDGEVVGGLGVAGGPPEKDAEIAIEVLRAIGAEEVALS